MRQPQLPRRRRPCTRRTRTWFAATAALCLLVAGLPPSGERPVQAAEGERADGPRQRVIIEFAGPAALAGRQPPRGAAARDAASGLHAAAAVEAAREAIGRQHATVLAEAARRRLDVRARREFGLLVNAVAAEVGAADVERLRDLPEVVAVHPDRRFSALLDVSVPLVGAPALWEGDGADRPPATGQGQVVAVIDTGVDYTHPALGGGFGPGFKVVAGHDYVNGDGDPMDDHGHGTHVAGIVAAEGAVTGVAPGASLTAYKVLGAGGFGFESDIVAALEDAADPANPYRADVINLSLGAESGPQAGPLDEAARAAAESGIVVVAAAGNAGPHGYSVGSPATAPGVIAVAASISGVRVPRIDIVEPGFEALDAYQVGFSANAPEEPVLAEVVDVGSGMPWDYQDLNVAGKAVLVQGPGAFSVFAATLAKERGAVAALFSWRASTPVAPAIAGAPGRSAGRDGHGHDFPHSPAAGALAQGPGPRLDDGRFERFVVVDIPPWAFGAIERQRAQGPVVVRIGGHDATDEIARFSSRGPGRDYHLKPEISAPGASILSTVPTALHAPGTHRFSGTSMAAPHVAGAAALLGQARPGWSGRQVAAALVGTAVPLEGWSPLAQGAGRLDVQRAASPALLADPPALSLGVAGSEAPLAFTSDVTLSNPTGQPVTVTFRHERRTGSASAEVDSPDLTLEPGAEATVTVSVTAAPVGGDTDHTGWVVAEPAGVAEADGVQAALHIPYAAFERTLLVRVTDPAFDTTEAFVYSPVQLAAPPAVTVTGPGGFDRTVEAVHDHGRWWRASLPLGEAGTYRARASAVPQQGAAAGPARLSGEAAFEALAAHQRLKGTSGWVPVGPDSGGGTMAAAGHRGLVVATEGPSTLFVTGDEGRTWRQHNDLPVAAAQVGHVAVDPSDPQRLYYAVSGGFTDPTYRGRVLASPDRGLTWSALPFPDTGISGLHAGPGGLLVATTDTGVHLSGDGGATWEHVPVPWEPWAASGAALVDSDLYVVTFDGLWVLRGLGSAPAPEAELLWVPPGAFPWVTAVAAEGSWLYAAAVDAWAGTVYRSGDGGRTWEALVETEGPVMGLEVAGSQVIATGFGFLLWGSQYGETWTQGEEPVHGGLMLGAATWAQPGHSWWAPGRDGTPRDVLVGVHQAGTYASAGPGAGWERIGVQSATVHSLVATDGGAAGGDLLLAGTPLGLYRTPAPASGVTPEVRDWGRADGEGAIGGDVVLLTATPHEDGVLYRVTQDAISGFVVERSDDHGALWSGQHYERERALAILAHPEDPERVYVSFANIELTGLLVTTDGGRTWSVHYQEQPMEAIAADPRDPDRLWLGSAAGLYRSDDRGATARLVLPGPVTAVHVDPRVPERIVLGGETLRVSHDGGVTFEAADHARLPMRVSTIVASPADPDTMFAGTVTHYTAEGLLQGGRGVLASRDGGRTWHNTSDSLQNRSVTSLALTGDGRFLFAGTTAGGVHRLRVR